MIEFEKHYDGKEIEKQMQKYWADNKIHDFAHDKSRPL